MFLSNDPQYGPTTGVIDLASEEPTAERPLKVYSLSGQLVRSALDRSGALRGLSPGIYIVGNRKVVIK
jgi:hypothetical protein